MSRSRRKTPIFGLGSATSERTDKQIWHSRFRTVERTRLMVNTPLEDYQAPDPRLVGPVWSFCKDGKNYWKPTLQQDLAQHAARIGKTPAEQQSLARRYLAKLKAK